MWKKEKSNLDFVDSKIIKRDFIVAEGSTLSYTFLDGEKNPFERDIYSPIFYLFKVHRNHPIRIFHSGIGYSNVWPANENKKSLKNFRMPAEVVKDKMNYDLTTFMLVPFDINFEGNIQAWKKFLINDGFVSEEDSPIIDEMRKTKQDVSLLYCPHGVSIHSQDYFHRLSEVMPSQVIKHFFSWLTEEKEITSHKQTFDKKLEGKVLVAPEIAREVTANIFKILEERYSTRLLFDRYKEDFSDIFRFS
jgi:hypothetical protein